MTPRQATISDLTVLIDNCTKQMDSHHLDRRDREHMRQWLFELKAQRQGLLDLELETDQ